MDRMKTSRWLLAVAFVAGCGDDPQNVGNADAGQVDVPGLDAGPRDTGPGDTGPGDTGPADTGPADTGPADAGPADTGPEDVGQPPVDTGPADAGQTQDVPPPVDVGVDAGPPDAGPMDAGPADTGTGTDTGPADTGPRDTGPSDTGPTDAGPSDTGPSCTPSLEMCNGRDDDCDGLIDEGGCGTHLQLTEVVVSPAAGEFVEVHNPTMVPVPLTNVYIADTAEYPCRLGMMTCTPAVSGSISSTDFIARFPEPVGGVAPTLLPGQYIAIALGDPAAFRSTYMRCPDYYLRGAADMMCPAARLMRSAGATGTNTIGGSSGLTDGGEPVVLFSWDQTSPRVVDLDYVVYGNPSDANARVNKTGLMSAVGGMTATYLNDTAPGMQSTLTVHGTGRSNVRCDFSEGTEVRTGGNGLMGHNETSENWAQTWRTSPLGTPVLPSITPGGENNCR